MAGHTERDFETAIEHGLIASGGYRKGDPKKFDAETALFPDDVIGFIRAGQPARWDQLEAMLKERTAATIIDSLTKELASKGALGVLRHGFKCYGKTLRLAYFRPNSGMNPEAQARYEANRLTITRQVEFISDVLKRPDGAKRKCVIIEHFRLHVMHELGGRAKAMVVTGSRLSAVRYKQAFDRYVSDKGYQGIRALVAFSGTVEDPDISGSSYTEVGMNDGLPEKELPERFAGDDYRVLIVADGHQSRPRPQGCAGTCCARSAACRRCGAWEMIRIGALDRKFGAPTSRVSEFAAKEPAGGASTPAERGRASSRCAFIWPAVEGLPAAGFFWGIFDD